MELFFVQHKFNEYVRQYTVLFASFVIFSVTFLPPGLVHGEYIAQINFLQGEDIDRVFIKLLEKDAPLTVENFRNYVSDEDYTNSFIHRVASDSTGQNNLIIQGGGFTLDSLLNGGDFIFDAAIDPQLGGLQLVPEDTPVVNEFGNSNVRGTLAMAKLELDPNSATSQWFVNLVDNSFLDTQNGGFTVFAEVLGNGMDVIDEIANQPVFDGVAIHTAFGSLPLVNFAIDPVPLNPEIGDSLIRVNSITEVLSISADINFGTVTPNTNLQPEVVLLNTGNDSVSIGAFEGQKSLSSPYRIVNNFCSNRTLLPGQRCSVIVLFEPDSSGDFDDSFDIEFPDLGLNYLVKLTGKGGSDVNEPDISSGFSSIDFGIKDVIFNLSGSPYRVVSTIRNFGDAQLDLFSITLTSDSDSEFSLSGSCIGVSALAFNETCEVIISYFPLDGGSHTAKLVLESNDPDENSFEIPIFATALGESDGIDKAVEDAAPNKGDGNNDSILDSQQSNVVSLPDLKGNYNTYVLDSRLNTTFADVRIVNQNVNDANPDKVILEAGVHEFTLTDIRSDAIVDVGLLLPVDIDLSAYYIYGSTPQSSAPVWYKFDMDGDNTGASFVGRAEFTSPEGNTVERNVILLRIKNGGRGDSSGVEDNKIVVKGGINYSRRTSSGSLSFPFLQIIILPLFLLRTFSRSAFRY